MELKAMTSHQAHRTGVSIRRDLALIYVASLITATLMAAVSIAGLLYHTAIYPTEALRRAFMSNDVVNLLVGLPILLGSMWLTRRGKLLGLLCWPGALFFVLYNYIIYAFAAPLTWAFPFYLALVMLSVYSLIALLAGIEGKAVHQGLRGAVPERLAGGVLVGLGILFFLRATGVIANALASGGLISETDLATNISDFLTAPAWVIGGILLWRRKEFGYVAGLGLLFQASMLFIALIIFLLLQPFLTTAPFALIDVVVVFAMGLICFIPFLLFVRAVVETS